MKKTEAPSKDTLDKYYGCLIGGAIGDALGYPVEFHSEQEIIEEYGEAGVMELQIGPTGKALVSDDTQLTIFTAEGLLRGMKTSAAEDNNDLLEAVFNAYRRWRFTQQEKYEDVVNYWKLDYINGWLLGMKNLYERRAPGHTCLISLYDINSVNHLKAANNSKGNGGVMRMAPAGLMLDEAHVFESGVNFAGITHGHPSGYLAAGVFAKIINEVVNGIPIVVAADNALKELVKHKDCKEVKLKVKQAISLAFSKIEDKDAILEIGQGFVAEEALGIALYCSLKSPNDYQKAVLMAVNHGGDSDSTGSMTGNIVGALVGLSGIRKDWIAKVEFADVLKQLVDDYFYGDVNSQEWKRRYPVYKNV